MVRGEWCEAVQKFSAKPENHTQPCHPSLVQIQPYIERLNAGGTQIPLRNPISLDTEPLLEPVGLPPAQRYERWRRTEAIDVAILKLEFVAA